MNIIDALQALLNVAAAARSLTELGHLGNGSIVIGPVGWEQLQAALHRLDEIQTTVKVR